jgi:anti-sigma-K factor RskA
MSHPEPESLRDLAAAYALGALSAEEAERFERFLADSPEAQREVAEFRDVAALLALAGPDATPDGALRERVLARVREGKTRPIARQGNAVTWVALAASLLVAVGLGASLLSVRGETARLRGMLDRTTAVLAAREATLNAILEPGVEMYQLTASGDPDPGIQLFWDRDHNRALLHAYRLRPVDPGKAYQLWFIQDGKPVPSVTFKPESSGRARVEQVPVPIGGDISAAAVTVEPETGSSQPTSPIVMVGPLKKS